MRGIWKERVTLQGLPLAIGLFSGSVWGIIISLTIVVLVEFLVIDQLYGSKYSGLLREAIEVIAHAVSEIPGIGWPIKSVISAWGRKKEIEEGTEARDTARRIVNDFQKIAFSEFELEDLSDNYDERNLEELLVEETELVKFTGYPLLAEEMFEDNDSESRKAILTAIFCREQNKVKEDGIEVIFTGERVAIFREAVKEKLSDFDFESPGGSEEKFLKGFAVLEPAIESGELDSTIEEENVDYKDIFERLTRRYTAIDFNVTYGGSDERHINNRILDVVYRGELNAERVKQDIEGLIESEIEKIEQEREDRQAFLLSSKTISETGKTNWGDFQDKFESKFPEWIKFGNKYAPEPEITDNSNKIKVSMQVVFPKKRYGSPKDFFSHSIEPITPEGVLVTVSQLDISPFYTDESREKLHDIADNESNVDLIFDANNYLITSETRRSITAEALDNLLINRRVDVSELLRALPLNVFVPYITEEEEKIFSENQDQIEDELGINEFADWSSQDPVNVTEQLKKADQRGISNRWNRIAQDVVEEVQKCTL